MKLLRWPLCLFATVFLSCTAAGSGELQSTLSTDKDVYHIGDTIRLTLKMFPTEGQRKLRLYENYKNLEVSFSLVNEGRGVLNDKWISNSGQTLPATSEKVVSVAKENPFKKTFTGIIQADSTTVTLDFAELKLKVCFDKQRLRRDSVRVHGFYNPIHKKFGDALEAYFEVEDFKVNIDR